MLLKDISFTTPQENILLDEVLLLLAEENQQGQGEVLRFWESPEVFVVLGRIGKLEEEVFLKEVAGDRIPVLRRFSGGGTVLQGKGCLNYTLILSKESRPQIRDLSGSYQFILGKIILGLKALKINAVFRPISDIALTETEKKFSGNAQHRGKKYILHHGTILYQFDLPLMGKYLKFPREIPLYRQGRSHSDFVANIPCRKMEIEMVLKEVWEISTEKNGLSVEEKKYLDRLLETKKIRLMN